MIYDRRGVLRADPASGPGLFFLGHEMRLMNPFHRHVGQFRHVAANVLAIVIEFFTLNPGIENPLALHRIRSRGVAPLPVPVVGSQVSVDELLHEISLAALPINPEILHQKGGDHHSHAVVHPTGLIQLAHAGAHNRVARPALTPVGKQSITFRPLRQGRRKARLRFEWSLGHARKGRQDLLKELAPDEFIHPREDIGARHSASLRENVQGSVNRGARGDRPEAQVRGELGGAVDCREIPAIDILMYGSS